MICADTTVCKVSRHPAVLAAATLGAFTTNLAQWKGCRVRWAIKSTLWMQETTNHNYSLGNLRNHLCPDNWGNCGTSAWCSIASSPLLYQLCTWGPYNCFSLLVYIWWKIIWLSSNSYYHTTKTCLLLNHNIMKNVVAIIVLDYGAKQRKSSMWIVCMF